MQVPDEGLTLVGHVATPAGPAELLYEEKTMDWFWRATEGELCGPRDKRDDAVAGAVLTGRR